MVTYLFDIILPPLWYGSVLFYFKCVLKNGPFCYRTMKSIVASQLQGLQVLSWVGVVDCVNFLQVLWFPSNSQGHAVMCICYALINEININFSSPVLIAQLSKSYFFNSPFSRNVQCEVNEKTSTGMVEMENTGSEFSNTEQLYDEAQWH